MNRNDGNTEETVEQATADSSATLRNDNQGADEAAETPAAGLPDAEMPDAEMPDAETTAAGKPAAKGSIGDQLVAQRAAHWHQEGQKLLTIETMKEWLQRSGLVQYMPRPQLGAPAPSWVEATLGEANAAPEMGVTDAARTLLARLIAEGTAVPLNLLGATGGVGTDVPDFVASAAVFSYIFTLRGNKAWKQAPATSGAVKVSPLALAAYEILEKKVPMSAYDLATQLGKEVTEGAVLRALTELWSQLRVLPVVQWDGAATVWELASARFTKQIKAGANAGQPSALSALISLYLGQAMAATEDEIESFLSPLASRSRVRDVIHALLAGRQLETLVVKGKTLLHLTGDAPVFTAVEEAPAVSDGASRISKFAGKPGDKLGTGLRTKPKAPYAGKPGFGKKPFGAKPAFGSKPFGAKPGFGDRERRPFRREDAPARPRFDKPWEEKAPSFEAPRVEAASEGFGGEVNASEGASVRREFPPREERKTFSKPGTFGRKREGFGGKPAFGRSPGGSSGYSPRPAFGSSDRGEGRPPRREFGASDRGERPAAGGFKRPGSYSPRPAGERGGANREFGSKPSFGPKRDFGGKPSFGAKPFGAKPGFGRSRPDAGESGGEAPRKVFRKFDAPRSPKPFGSKPGGGKFFGSKGGGDRPERPARSFGDRPGGDRPRPAFGDRPRPAFGDKPGGFAGKSNGPRKSFGDKPGGFGAKKPFGSKPGGSGFGGAGKPGGPFAKFADGKKPFRKPGPGKKTERGGSSAGGGDGYRPTKRRRPEGGGD